MASNKAAVAGGAGYALRVNPTYGGAHWIATMEGWAVFGCVMDGGQWYDVGSPKWLPKRPGKQA